MFIPFILFLSLASTLSLYIILFSSFYFHMVSEPNEILQRLWNTKIQQPQSLPLKEKPFQSTPQTFRFPPFICSYSVSSNGAFIQPPLWSNRLSHMDSWIIVACLSPCPELLPLFQIIIDLSSWPPLIISASLLWSLLVISLNH